MQCNWVYLITGLDYWTPKPRPFILLLLFKICFILKCKQATGLKLCKLIENIFLYKMGKFVYASGACVVANEFKNKN